MSQRRQDEPDLTQDWASLFEEQPNPGRRAEAEAFFQPVRRERSYSEDAMRRVHEGQSQYDDSPPPRSARTSAPKQASRSVQPSRGEVPQRQQRVQRQRAYEPEEEEEEEPVRAPRRRRHGVLRFLFRLLLALLLVAALCVGGLLLFAKMPRTSQPIAARKSGCSTILLAGTDMSGERTDTIMLLYLDPEQEQMHLLSIPRDTMVNRDNPVPKINGAYGANGAGNAGMEALLDYAQDLLGYRPDGYLLIDFNCFAELVDLMGGVTYDVPMDMQYEDPLQDLKIDLKQGLQHLNGEKSMCLVRFRSGYEAADLQRVNVQRDFIATALRQWISVLSIPRVPFAMKLVMENTTTNLSFRELVWVGKTVLRCRGGFSSDTLPGYGDYINGGSYYIESVYDAAALINERYNPYQTTIYPDDLHPYGR